MSNMFSIVTGNDHFRSYRQIHPADFITRNKCHLYTILSSGISLEINKPAPTKQKHIQQEFPEMEVRVSTSCLSCVHNKNGEHSAGVKQVQAMDAGGGGRCER